jgi:hypothetical protein
MTLPPLARKLPTINLFATIRKDHGRKHFTGFAYLADEGDDGPGEFIGDVRGILPTLIEKPKKLGRPKKIVEDITLLAHVAFVRALWPNLPAGEARNEAVRIITNDPDYVEVDSFGEQDKSRGVSKKLKKAKEELQGLYVFGVIDQEAREAWWIAVTKRPAIIDGAVIVDSSGWFCRIGESAKRCRHIKWHASISNQ